MGQKWSGSSSSGPLPKGGSRAGCASSLSGRHAHLQWKLNERCRPGCGCSGGVSTGSPCHAGRLPHCVRGCGLVCSRGHYCHCVRTSAYMSVFVCIERQEHRSSAVPAVLLSSSSSPLTGGLPSLAPSPGHHCAFDRPCTRQPAPSSSGAPGPRQSTLTCFLPH